MLNLKLWYKWFLFPRIDLISFTLLSIEVGLGPEEFSNGSSPSFIISISLSFLCKLILKMSSVELMSIVSFMTGLFDFIKRNLILFFCFIIFFIWQL